MDAGRITSKIGDMRGTSRSSPGKGVLMNGDGTVPQEGDIFVNFEMFWMSIFLVCLINLSYSTRVLSIKTFPTELLLKIGLF